MSKSPGDGKVEGTLRVPSGSNNGTRSVPTTDPAAEIQAEINDHLATAAEQLQSQGLAESAAHKQSQQKFGDTAAIRRRCYWIQQGDALMFRTAVIALLSILCLALGATVFTTLRSQRQTAEQMSVLAEQLKLLAEQQRAPASTPAVASAPEIGGNVYYGSMGNKPAAVTEVMICRAGDGEVVRRLWTTDEGHFHSGPLVAGDYTILAKGIQDAPEAGAIQTEPIQAYAGRFDIGIDATYRNGRIHVEPSRPLPRVEVEGKYTIDSRLYITVSSAELQSTRWTTARPIPDRWPIFVRRPDTPPQRDNSTYSSYSFESIIGNDGEVLEKTIRSFGDRRQPEPLYERRIPAGPCLVTARVVLDVLPHEEASASDPSPGARPRTRLVQQALKSSGREWMSPSWVQNDPLGSLWLYHLREQKNGWESGTSLPRLQGQGRFGSLSPTTSAKIPVRDGQLTRLRVELPTDLEPRIQELLDSVTDPEQFEKAVLENNPFIRDAEITVIESKPPGVGGMF